ncbi:unnamed protein product, partial [Phaeothamnion confervicola]
MARFTAPSRSCARSRTRIRQTSTSQQGEELYQPSRARVEGSAMTRFAAEASRLTGRDLAKYSELHAWSVASPDAFWAACADFCGVKWAKPPEEGGIFIPPPSGRMRGATWFCGARLNFAENCMPAPTDRVALVSVTEGASGPVVVGMTGREIHIQVARCAAALRNAGVRPGDRVAGVMANTSEALVCSLAATAVGAVWSSCSPDFGVGGVLDRLGQVSWGGEPLFPSLLFLAGILFFSFAVFALVLVMPILFCHRCRGRCCRSRRRCPFWCCFVVGAVYCNGRFLQWLFLVDVVLAAVSLTAAVCVG